jgi:endonuclease/exonuclease/phosphatase family metal-dependent hydrolase
MKLQIGFLSFLLCGILTLHAQSRLNLMSYNIRYDITTSNASPWNERHKAISSQLNRFDVDIVGMQEVLVHQKEQMLLDLPGYESIGVGRDDGKNAGEFSPIFYKEERFRVLKSGTFWLSPTPDIPSKGWDAALNRICTYAQFFDLESKQSFWVFNTHFDHVGEVARMKSSVLILQKIQEVTKGKREIVIFCGDLNLNDDHPTISFLQAQMKDALHGSKQVKSKMNKTFNNFDLKNEASNRIDYIFTNKKVEILTFETIVEPFGISYPSDHFPILTTLKLKK